MIDLSSTVARFAAPLVVKRQRPSVLESGRLVQNDIVDEFDVMGCIQPLSPRETEKLPEGYRADATRLLWVDSPLRTGEAQGELPDRVEFDGRTFELKAAKDWGHHGGYYRYLVVKVGQ